MFGRRKKNKLDEDSGDGSGNTIEIGQKSPSQEVEESSGFGIYFILAIAFLVLLSLVFLFYSVIPSIVPVPGREWVGPRCTSRLRRH